MRLDHGQEYSHYLTTFEAAETFSGMNSFAASSSTRKNKNKNKRRFSDEQIRSLESIFESESRLEPSKKLQLACELGLEPRQVAIWFQNKRARWKSKQLERDYSKLQANFNNLVSKFEALKKEKQALIIQMQKMNEVMQSPREESQCCEQALSGNNIDRESEGKLNWSLEKSKHGLGVLSDDDSSIKAEYFGIEDEEPNLINMVEPGDSSMTSPEDWGSLNSDGLFDESSTSYQWWDFWS